MAGLVNFLLLESRHYQPFFGHGAAYSASVLTTLRIATVLMFCGILYGTFLTLVYATRKSHEKLITSAKLVALGEMAAGIAHEINNPMTRVVVLAEKLEMLGERGPVEQGEALSIARAVVDTAMRIASIIQGLQAFSRDSTHDDLDKVPLAALIDSTLSFCRARMHARNIELRVQGASEEEWVLARESQLAQILLNLVNNSMDAVESLGEKWIEILTRARGEYYEIVVTDSGHGIASPIRHRMFEPFFTTKPVGRGTGLGLSISRGIASAYGGALVYDESSPRTRFILRLPKPLARSRNVEAVSLKDPIA